MDKIQGLRDLARPWLTFLFSSSFVALVFIFAFTEESLTFDQKIAMIGLVSNPLSGMLGYHFGKKTNRDSV